jgi:hypothetical protein
MMGGLEFSAPRSSPHPGLQNLDGLIGLNGGRINMRCCRSGQQEVKCHCGPCLFYPALFAG